MVRIGESWYLNHNYIVLLVRLYDTMRIDLVSDSLRARLTRTQSAMG